MLGESRLESFEFLDISMTNIKNQVRNQTISVGRLDVFELVLVKLMTGIFESLEEIKEDSIFVLALNVGEKEWISFVPVIDEDGLEIFRSTIFFINYIFCQNSASSFRIFFSKVKVFLLKLIHKDVVFPQLQQYCLLSKTVPYQSTVVLYVLPVLLVHQLY